MTKAALEERVTELEQQVAVLKIMVEEARIVADVEHRAADEMERRMQTWLSKQEWAQAAQG